MGITTFTRITAKDPSSDLLDEGSVPGKAFKATIDDALAQGACQRVHFGREVEDKNNYWIFAEWDSVEERLAYVQSQAFQAVSKVLFEHVDGTKVLSKHFTPLSSLNSPAAFFAADGLGAIEVLSLHFPGDLSDAEKAESESLWKDFQDQGLETSPALRGGVAGGWSVEKDVPVLGEGHGVGMAMMLLLGWTTVEAHMANRETEAFLEAAPLLLKRMPRRCGLGMCHVIAPATRS